MFSCLASIQDNKSVIYLDDNSNYSYTYVEKWFKNDRVFVDLTPLMPGLCNLQLTLYSSVSN